jgi:surface-anchored protein
VFSAPGVYLARVEITADLIDGSTVKDTRDVRFAVGSSTSTDDAFAAAWREAPADTDAAKAAAAPVAGEPHEDPPAATTIAAIAIAGIGLAAGLVFVVLRGNRAKRRARAAGGR